ncbi:nucleotide exchange factor SIL1 [Oncorhynchus tshawytscha]|uniref:Nucleotide exchange factor SIL1 n=1 Tax=Oncorhynchus tshawytscha TaxID=74940 RepID=A0A8C8H6N9_ONCTS|nr:nucleotide exchange factor SIL1 [Oncorhynchus tshawytscha]XP_024238291.1 nucleotide exchange factor SIL1 [Oncorhynchus tshawytscha]
MLIGCRRRGRQSTRLRVALMLLVFICQFVHVLSEKSPSALTVVESPEASLEGEEDAHVEEGDSEDLDVFHPTDKWKTLKPGHGVPRGSQVRLNLQTGQREVKLGEHQTLKYQIDGQRQGKENTQGPSVSAEELKKALKNIKEGVDPKTSDKEETEALRAQFHTMDELKKDMVRLDMLMESDFQIMSRLVSQFNSSNATVEEKVKALHDLEYLVHQVDNAQNLASRGGLKLVVDALNNTDYRLQESASFVLGSALSSNPVVQVEAVESGTLQKLLMLLATPRPMSVKKRALFALACLLRHCPFAQSHFLKLGGLQVLGDIFRASGGGAVRVRIVTILYDMINEKELISQTGLDPIPDASHNERLRQYAQVSLQPLLAEQGWCSLVPELLASPEHDWKEKALRTILAMMPHCQTQYRKDYALSSSLSALQEQYQELVLTEQVLGDEDGYFGEILALLETVVLKLKQV